MVLQIGSETKQALLSCEILERLTLIELISLELLTEALSFKLTTETSELCRKTCARVELTEVLAKDVAVADDKFVVNYFRLSEDKRLLFGGRENYGLGFPTDILTALRARMERLFPQIAGVGIDYHWGGTLGITMTRLPMLRRIGPTTLAAGGFSGHGVALTGLAGKVMAEAVAGQAGRFDLFSSLPVPPFPGGRHARAPLLTLAMTWFALRDRLGL